MFLAYLVAVPWYQPSEVEYPSVCYSGPPAHALQSAVMSQSDDDGSPELFQSRSTTERLLHEGTFAPLSMYELQSMPTHVLQELRGRARNNQVALRSVYLQLQSELDGRHPRAPPPPGKAASRLPEHEEEPKVPPPLRPMPVRSNVYRTDPYAKSFMAMPALPAMYGKSIQTKAPHLPKAPPMLKGASVGIAPTPKHKRAPLTLPLRPPIAAGINEVSSSPPGPGLDSPFDSDAA